MARQLRLEYPGALLHATSRGNERRLTFRDDADRRTFLDALAKAVDRFRWILLAYVLMPNHFHLFLRLTEETFSIGMQWLNGKYAQAFNRRHGRVGHLFQGRPKAALVDEDSYFLTLLRYIVLNPVRARIVERPQEYEWSSHRAVLGAVDAPSWLAVDDVLVAFAPDREKARELYRRFVDEGVGMAECPWDALADQLYLGSESWRKSMGVKVALKPRVDEHPFGQRTPERPQIGEIVSVVAGTLCVDEQAIREGHWTRPRMIAAWLARHEGLHPNGVVAAALRIRSSGHVANLVKQCDHELDGDVDLQKTIDQCIATLRRKNQQPKV